MRRWRRSPIRRSIRIGGRGIAPRPRRSRTRTSRRSSSVRPAGPRRAGGLAAAAAFLERAAALSGDSARAAGRIFAAAAIHTQAGSFEEASALLDAVERGSLDELALMTAGSAAAAPILWRALRAFASPELPVEDGLRWGWIALSATFTLWDEENWQTVAVAQVHLARDVGALARLPIDLNHLAGSAAWSGDFERCASLRGDRPAEPHSVPDGGRASAPVLR